MPYLVNQTYDIPNLGVFIKIQRYDEKSNQFVIHFDLGEILISYNSVIAIVVYLNNEIYIGEDYKHSKTTGKYRNYFLSETLKETEAKIESSKYKLLNI